MALQRPPCPLLAYIFAGWVACCGISVAQDIQSPADPAGIPTATGEAHNGPPQYPVLSKRMGEQGRVEVKVLIDTQGTPLKAEVARSSGFSRLDASAVDAAMRWRYQPGRRNGIAEPMWMLIPINFILEGVKSVPSQ